MFTDFSLIHCPSAIFPSSRDEKLNSIIDKVSKWVDYVTRMFLFDFPNHRQAINSSKCSIYL